MCFIVQEDQLDILPFHRLIKPVVPIDRDNLFVKLNTYFEISKSSTPIYDIKEKHHFGVYLDKQWYLLIYKNQSEKLDVELLEDIVVREIFTIADSRTDSQIAFHAHTSGMRAMVDLIDSNTYSVAFTSKACDFNEVRKVADNDKTLPPKSTYIEPKLRAAMLIQEFEVL